MRRDPLESRAGLVRAAFGKAGKAPQSRSGGIEGRKKRPAPISLRLTDDERARLMREAAGRPLNGYIRERLFVGLPAARSKRRRSPVKDRDALARVLSALGQSNLAEDFAALTWSLEDGVLRLGPDCERAVQRACDDIAAMRRDLIKALGLKAR